MTTGRYLGNHCMDSHSACSGASSDGGTPCSTAMTSSEARTVRHLPVRRCRPCGAFGWLPASGRAALLRVCDRLCRAAVRIPGGRLSMVTAPGIVTGHHDAAGALARRTSRSVGSGPTGRMRGRLYDTCGAGSPRCATDPGRSRRRRSAFSCMSMRAAHSLRLPPVLPSPPGSLR